MKTSIILLSLVACIMVITESRGASLEANSYIALSRFRRESGPVKRHSLKCDNDCLSSDDNGLTSYLACLKTCDNEDQDGDEDDNVTDDNDKVDGDKIINDNNVENVDSDDGDVVYY